MCVVLSMNICGSCTKFSGVWCSNVAATDYDGRDLLVLAEDSMKSSKCAV